MEAQKAEDSALVKSEAAKDPTLNQTPSLRQPAEGEYKLRISRRIMKNAFNSQLEDRHRPRKKVRTSEVSHHLTFHVAVHCVSLSYSLNFYIAVCTYISHACHVQNMPLIVI